MTSNGAGVYSIAGVAPGEYEVGATNSLGPAGYGYGDPVAITVNAGSATVQDLVLIPYASGDASVTGIIRDVQTGSPIFGANITLYGDSVAFTGSDASDASGCTSSPLGRGNVLLLGGGHGLRVPIGNDHGAR